MRTFEYVAVTILGLVLAAWLAVSVASGIAGAFAKVNPEFEQVNGKKG
jgi:hypothetical protein